MLRGARQRKQVSTMIEISVSNVKKSFEIGNNILDGITFQVETGERVGLLGRNGAGKSTLFKILTGELEQIGRASCRERV